MPAKDTRPLLEKLLSKTMPVPWSGCWLWTDHVSNDGYGRFKYQNKEVGAHRVSWLAHNGEIPSGLQVLHRCDVPSCIRPDHLWLGTHDDNMADKARKGRAPGSPLKGQDHWNAKLSNADVYTIRLRLAAGERGCDLAAEYMVVRSVISNLKNNKRRIES